MGHQEALIEVPVLMKKSKEEKIKTPLRREVLSMPPFLRSQLEKIKLTFLIFKTSILVIKPLVQ